MNIVVGYDGWSMGRRPSRAAAPAAGDAVTVVSATGSSLTATAHGGSLEAATKVVHGAPCDALVVH